jgi:hypothetical protein
VSLFLALLNETAMEDRARHSQARRLSEGLDV